MNDDEKVALETIEPIAQELKEALAPHCAAIEIAGSIRRQRERVKDIEVVCIPYVNKMQSLFEDAGPAVHNDGFCKLVRGWQERSQVAKGEPKTGRYCKFTYKGMKVDLFMCSPLNWGIQYLIRTGPGGEAGFSAYVMQQLKRQGYYMHDGHVWSRRTQQVVHVLHEQDVFDLAGLPWLPPHQRDSYKAHLKGI
jgi:DNA polymerase/3'-5' exonuclease PolX